MCFSASASFTSSAVLSVAGVTSIVYARNTPQRVLGSVPLLFSIQQFIEGVLWMSMMHPGWARWQTATTYGFQVFAQMLWPVYMPLCAVLFEQRAGPKSVERWLLLFGILLSGYTGFCLYEYPVHASVGAHHIKYDSGFPLAQKWYYGVLYFIPTIVAPLISSERILQWLGGLFFVSYIVARLLFHYYEISVWCFFGAVISLVVLASIVRSRSVVVSGRLAG